jgi:autotransporter-associated beta strand protein
VVQGTDFATVISGTGIVSQIGSNSLTLNGANTYSGGTRVSSGTLTAGSATAFGTGTLTVNGGALDSSVASLAMTANNAQVWNTDFAFTGTNSLNLGTGTVSLGSTAGNRTVTANASTLTIGGIISNGTATGLTKAGGGTMILSGNNAYTGTTGINAGTLQANHASALGNGGNITFGGGTLQFSSVFNNATAAWGARIVSSGSAVTLDTNGQNVTVSGNIDSTNTGGLAMSGAGILTLTGSNTYTGGTAINGGTLSLGSANAIGTSGTVTFGGGTLQYSAANSSDNSARFSNAASQQYRIDTNSQSVTLATALTSSGGSFTKLGAGTLTLSGANTYNGGTTVSAGILVGTTTSLQGAITNNAAVTFDQAVDGTYAAAMSGTGSLTKLGAGTLTLSGSNSYNGATTVSAGKLVVDGSISTSTTTTISSGATLGGSGTLGALTINSGGFVTPGNSPGILTVNGNYSQAGQYTAEIAGTTAGSGYDQINVLGTVDISGGSLVASFSGTYAQNDLLFILLNDDTDAINGTFAGYAQGATFASYGYMDWQISYTADSGNGTFTGGNDIAIMAIPEPSSCTVAGIGLAMLLGRRSRSRKNDNNA